MKGLIDEMLSDIVLPEPEAHRLPDIEPQFNVGQLVWVPRLKSSAIIGEMEAARDLADDLITHWNYRCCTKKGFQWISEEYLRGFEAWHEDVPIEVPGKVHD